MRIICFYIPVKTKRYPRGVLKYGILFISDTSASNNRCPETNGSAPVHFYVQGRSSFPVVIMEKVRNSPGLNRSAYEQLVVKEFGVCLKLLILCAVTSDLFNFCSEFWFWKKWFRWFDMRDTG